MGSWKKLQEATRWNWELARLSSDMVNEREKGRCKPVGAVQISYHKKK